MQSFDELCKKVDEILEILKRQPTIAQVSTPAPAESFVRNGGQDWWREFRGSPDLEECLRRLDEQRTMMLQLGQSVEGANGLLRQNSGDFQNLAQENTALRQVLQQLLLNLASK